jgi:hypothetical protein
MGEGMDEEITERYNPATGQIELRCGHCGNAEEIPTRPRAKHEYGLSLPQWIAARAPRRFSYSARGNCALRGRVSWNDVVCSECGNMNTQDD